MNRRKQGLDDSNVKKVTLNDEPIHVDNDKSIVNGTENRPTLQDRVDYSKLDIFFSSNHNVSQCSLIEVFLKKTTLIFNFFFQFFRYSRIYER